MKYNNNIHIVVSDNQYSYLLKYSKKLNISISQLLRMILDNLVINDKLNFEKESSNNENS